MRTRFSKPLSDFFAVTIQTPVPVDSGQAKALIDSLSAKFHREPYVTSVLSSNSLTDSTYSTRNNHTTVLVLALVWFYNLYNFIDGIDGLAASATIFIGVTMGVLLWLHGQPVLAGLCGFLAAASAAFLLFNWPPAKMFMGEAGSSFTSYVFSAICVESLRADPTLLWYWLLAGAVYFSDTTLTTLTRVLTVPGWYRPHRSHAYQNLARIWGNHRKVLLLVLAGNFCWVLPLLVLARLQPRLAMIVTIVAYVPITRFCFKYGPRFENK